MGALPEKSKLTIGFAHAAYQLADEFRARGLPFDHFEVRTPGDLAARIHEADVLVVSGLWRNDLLPAAGRLRLLQSVSAGTDQFGKDAIKAAGIRLASAQGANEKAVAEHAMALLLALARQVHRARDHQAKSEWRGLIADRRQRETEINGRTLVIVGLGRIGTRLARLAAAFGMEVIGVKRRPGTEAGAHRVVATTELLEVLPQADFVALTCPLTPETEGLVGAREFNAMKSTAYLINVARGRVVDEPALIDALRTGTIAGAALDCVHEEPLPQSSPLWGMSNVILTPHSAGETERYESNVIDLLVENIDRLYDGGALRNEV